MKTLNTIFFFRRIRRRNRGHKPLNFHLSLCFSAVFSLKILFLGCSFSLSGKYYFIFSLEYISSFEKRIIRGENKLVRAIKHAQKTCN